MKYMNHCLTVSILFLAFTLNGQDVQLSIDYPVRVNAGEDFEVTVTIDKGSLTDYSRFSQDLPLGLSASNMSSPNADFSFDEQRVRIIWLKLPESNEIKVSYLVSVDPRLKGTFTLGGVFAYVVGDERKFLNFTDRRPITIVPSSTVDQSQIVDINDFRGGAPPVARTVAPAVTPRVTPAATASGGEPFAMAVRQKPQLLSNGSYMVHLLIDNPPGSKYAKIEETIPSGYVAQEVDTHEGIVSNAASMVKFIWMKMPAQSEFEVTYQLNPLQNQPQGNMLIEGTFTYTSGDENKVSSIVEVDVSLADLSAAQKKELLASGNTSQMARTTQPARTVPQTTTTPARTETRTSTTTANTGGATQRTIVNTRVLDPGTGVYFRVQLSANVTAIDATAFYREIGIDREVLVEHENGYYKYTVGPFQTYDQALSYKDQVDRLPEVEGAFVVGYRNGSRVSPGSIR
jgi:hypothetical protein